MLSTGPDLRLFLRCLACVTIILLLPLNEAKRDLESACNTCQEITNNFNKGFERTAKQNFGGGNTAWEERKLSKYETSEIRLVEILEGLCESSSFECNRMVEEHEEHFETWWFKRKSKHPDLHKWFCVETLKVCCPKGTFGPDCNACVGGSERPCHGNGRCRGDGTRGGDGTCSCERGYSGELCLNCEDGHFSAQKNDTFCLCTECHSSCKTCSGGTNQDCDECKEGWREDDQEACVDVDECSEDSSPCREDQYCLNSEGSYSCKACDPACAGCHGDGANSCRRCADGYRDSEGTCTDVDECSGSEPACVDPNRFCLNSPGGFSCRCSPRFHDDGGDCVPDDEEQEDADHNEL
ncbi:cysteine-rich with EGF-like domain protein 2 [Menidia menidia]